EVVHQPGFVQHEAALALFTFGCRSPCRAEDVVSARRRVDPDMPQAGPPGAVNAEAEPGTRVEGKLREGPAR
ncbi:hypothetical protein, partial [Escherichia coli]|uniref:hypothetical protein n=1 Tax=Escherichia coli TaxID=562 RepID=UPI0032E4808A